jgi:hypothetical protein
MMLLRLHRFHGGVRPVAALLAAILLAASGSARAANAPGSPDPAIPAPQATPVQLAAAVERAWMGADANALASLCDSAVVRVALKPGSPPATAPTLNAVAFLIHDQLRLVVSRRFQVVRVDVDWKKRTARAWARWAGEWGGARGARDVEVVLRARATGEAGWLLTEIRAND